MQTIKSLYDCLIEESIQRSSHELPEYVELMSKRQEILDLIFSNEKLKIKDNTTSTIMTIKAIFPDFYKEFKKPSLKTKLKRFLKKHLLAINHETISKSDLEKMLHEFIMNKLEIFHFYLNIEGVEEYRKINRQLVSLRNNMSYFSELHAILNKYSEEFIDFFSNAPQKRISMFQYNVSQAKFFSIEDSFDLIIDSYCR